MNAQGLLRGIIAPAQGRGAVGSGRPGAAEGENELEPLALQAGRQHLPRCGGIGRLGGEREEVRAAQNMRRFRLSRRRRRRGLDRGRRRAVWPGRRAAPEQESPPASASAATRPPAMARRLVLRLGSRMSG
jgi:hypothetical protein